MKGLILMYIEGFLKKKKKNTVKTVTNAENKMCLSVTQLHLNQNFGYISMC